MITGDSRDNDATEVSGLDGLAAAHEGFAPGTHFGVYLIRGVLGEGGMGRVYLAEQTRPVRREVALKLIREQVESPLARAYFDVESQALAQMQHPAIAQVFDAGTTPEGHPYIAMEVVEGEPLTRFCLDENLDRDERLALFARVCHGVQHAHQKGVIHRDLKPANVLVRRVDGVPSPKIIDFGIAVGGMAGVDGDVDATAIERAGTAIYMSPEQLSPRARGLDTRSDVYSLGVMLYEVLTGREASEITSAAYRSTRALEHTLFGESESLPADTSRELLAAIRSIPDELRAVLRRALAADRAERYDSAVALAEDLERYRAHRPVKAMPATRAYFARTFVRRHRLAIAAAALVVFALIAGIAVAILGMREAQRSAEVARTEAAKAEQVADFARGMLAGIDPDRARNMDRSLMRLVLDSAASRAGSELKSQPAVRESIEYTIAESYAAIGEYALAVDHYDAALAAVKTINLGADAEARLRLRRAEIVGEQGHIDDAIAQARAALALVASKPEDDRTRLFVESRLAGLEFEAGQYEQCSERYRRIYAIQKRAFGEEDADTLDTLDGLARADTSAARFDEARALYADLIKSYTEQFGPDHSKTLGAINGLAIVDLEEKHFADAEKLLSPIVPKLTRLFGPEHPRTIDSISNLGGAIRQQGRNEEARPYYERVLELAYKVYGPDSYRTVIAESNLSLLLRDANQLDDAEKHARIAVDRAAKAFGADNAFRGIMYDSLGTILEREKRFADAEKEYNTAWSILASAKDYGPSHPRSQDVVDHYVELYGDWHKPEREAEWKAKKVAVAASG
jgi:eukaryotic-like serine/threonine-protein kinase